MLDSGGKRRKRRVVMTVLAGDDDGTVSVAESALEGAKGIPTVPEVHETMERSRPKR